MVERAAGDDGAPPDDSVSGGGLSGLQPGELSEVLEVGSEFLRRLAAVTPSEVDDRSLSDVLVALDGLTNRLDAMRGRLAGAWDARQVWVAEGARSGASWLASHTEQSRGAASGQIRLARALRAMPVVEAACLSGELGTAKARLLADAASVAPQVFAEHEGALVEHALGLRVDQTAKVLEFWKAHADPDGAEAREAAQHEARSVHLSQTSRGMWVLAGKLTGEAGEVLRNELDRRARAAFRSEKALADANGTVVETTAAQRRADALVELAMQAMAANDSGTALKAPSVTATVRVDDLADLPADGTTVVGETEHGQAVPAVTARRWLCDCNIGRVVLGPDSVPVDLGVSARLPSPAQRRALAARDRGCVFPGCDRHAGWASAHHLVHWIDGGATDLDNLALLCVFHHHRVHEGGYGVRRLPSGALEFTRPDGTILSVPKGRAPDPPLPAAA